MKLRYDGKVSGLLRTMGEAGIDMALTLGVALKASTVARTNEFIGSVRRDRFVPLRFGIPGAVARGESAPPPGQRHSRREA